VREAAALQEKLLGLLEAPSPQGARTGILFQKWRDVSMRVDANGLALTPKYLYLFFCKCLPAACRHYLGAGQPLPTLFQQRLNVHSIDRNGDGHIDRAEWNAAFRAVDRNGDGRIDRNELRAAFPKDSLRLTAWEYYLFLFCQWPLSSAGEVTAECLSLIGLPDGLSHHGPPSSGENALSDFVQKRWALKAPDSALGNVLALGVTNLDPLYGNVLGLGVTNLEPLYVIVLKSYLHHFLPLGISAERDARKRESLAQTRDMIFVPSHRQSPLSGALRADAELLLHSLSQFWLAQNGEPHLIKQVGVLAHNCRRVPRSALSLARARRHPPSFTLRTPFVHSYRSVRLRPSQNSPIMQSSAASHASSII